MGFLPRIAAAEHVSMKTVEFYHPYHNKILLFCLFVIGFEGVNYDVALTACQIVACNARGYLTAADVCQIDQPATSVLSGAKYFYHVPPDELAGALCPGEASLL
jgi:hypothetical protein